MSGRPQRATWVIAASLMLTTTIAGVIGQGTIDGFFEEFSADWVRRRPNQATQSRYFTGAEQNRLDQQLNPETAEFKRATVEQARRGLEELARFDRSRMSDSERVSADVMQWQLQIIVAGEPFGDFDYPLDQFDGANVRLPNLMTVVHPIRTENDARNYVIRLREVDDRLSESIEGAARLATKGIVPPRFILRSTVSQMRQFVGSPPAQNPLVATFVDRMIGVAELTPATAAATEGRGYQDRRERSLPGVAESHCVARIAAVESQRRRRTLEVRQRCRHLRAQAQAVHNHQHDGRGDSRAGPARG